MTKKIFLSLAIALSSFFFLSAGNGLQFSVGHSGSIGMAKFLSAKSLLRAEQANFSVGYAFSERFALKANVGLVYSNELKNITRFSGLDKSLGFSAGGGVCFCGKYFSADFDAGLYVFEMAMDSLNRYSMIYVGIKPSLNVFNSKAVSLNVCLPFRFCFSGCGTSAEAGLGFTVGYTCGKSIKK